MKWFLNLNKKYRNQYFLATFLIIIGDTVSIFPGMLLGMMIDQVVIKNNFNSVIYFSIVIVCCTLVRTMITLMSVMWVDTIGFKMIQNTKNTLYHHLMMRDDIYYQTHPLGELLTVLNGDVDHVRHFSCYSIKTIGAIVLSFLGAFVYLLFLNWQLTLFILSPASLILLLSYIFLKKTFPLFEERREQIASLHNYIQENIEANRIVKTFSTEKKEIAKFQNENDRLKEKNIGIQNKVITFTQWISICSESMTILLLIIGGLFIINGQLSIGGIVTFSSLIGYLKRPFLELNIILNDWQTYRISIKRLQNMWEAPVIVDHGIHLLPNQSCTITFQDVQVSYQEKSALKNFNLTIPEQGTIAFIGKIGSGKSTIPKLLLRLVSYEGKIKIGNIDIQEYQTSSLRDRIGYVAQTSFLFSDTILENIRFGNAEITEDEVKQILHLVKADFVFQLPEQMNTMIGENGVLLSGGEKQRICLARALVKKPSYLVLDDITSALDVETELEITKGIASLSLSCTKIIIAQKIISVSSADQIYVLEDGIIVEAGNHKELLEKKGFYYEIYRIQQKGLEVVK